MIDGGRQLLLPSVYSCALLGDLKWSPSLLEGAAHDQIGAYNSFHDPHRLSFSLFVYIV